MPRTLEELLLEEGLIDHVGLRQLQQRVESRGLSLVRLVLEAGVVREERLASLLAFRTGLPRVNLRVEAIDEEALREIPYHLADHHRLIPLSIELEASHRRLRLAMADPLDWEAVEVVELSTGCVVERTIALGSEITEAMQRHYRDVITKMIPRADAMGGVAQATQPNLRSSDMASADTQLRALVELLIGKGILRREEFEEVVRRLMREGLGK
jgi:type IV pilus assembly protein PilB